MKLQRNKTKCAVFAALTAGLAFGANAEPTIKDVTAQQRYPWNGMVDISYTVSGLAEAAAKDELLPSIKVLAIDRATTPWTTNVALLSCLSVGPYATEALAQAAATKDGEHQIVWDMNAQGLTFASTNLIFAVFGEAYGGVQLWEDGPYWSEYNVGANSPEESGYYFWWGDTVGYKRNAADDGWDAVDGSSTGFSFSSANEKIVTYNRSIEDLQKDGILDSDGNLVAKYDAATAHLGAPWRLPTKAELAAIEANCTTVWTNNWNGTGMNGRLITGQGDYASKSVFLPAVGYGENSNLSQNKYLGRVWLTDSTEDKGSTFAYFIRFYSGDFDLRSGGRYLGFSVRPVRTFSK